jgi:hypothetical protein
MHLSFFEAAMLICFGMSWPFSIWKSWKTRQVGSKSLVFLVCVFAGYLAGITHKVLYNLDVVVVFYVLNALMVATDTILYLRNSRLQRANAETGAVTD